MNQPFKLEYVREEYNTIEFPEDMPERERIIWAIWSYAANSVNSTKAHVEEALARIVPEWCGV